jgi:hypothetical protein
MSERITGKAAGGHKRAAALPPARRQDIAKRAAAARWSGEIKKATHGSDDHPLRVGDIEIPCYVLEDGTRVLSQRGLQTGIGMSIGGARFGEQRMAVFVDGIAQKGVDTKDLATRIRQPVRFARPEGGRSFGFEATVLADLCDVVLAAREQKVLSPQQAHIAKQCEILVRGFARIGIIALIDEATGYQRHRTNDALARILEAFIDKELQAYVQTFPSDFYEELFRLRGLEYPTGSVKRPQYFGVLTNDIVYKRLAPGVLEELKRITPKNEAGRPKQKFFQRLTTNLGYPKLREHLGAVVATMRLSSNWHDFKAKLDKHYPTQDGLTQLAFEYSAEEDDGKGL